MAKLTLDRFYSWFGTSPKISFVESVLNNEKLYKIDFLQNKIEDQIDLISILEDKWMYDTDIGILFEYTDKLPTEVLCLSAHIKHIPLTEQLPFSKFFNLILKNLFTQNLDESLQAFILSGKSFKFQLIFNYSDLIDVLQNTWVDSTSMEYITNQSPRNSVLKGIINVGKDSFENGKFRTTEFPIVSPIFEFIPSVNLLSKINNNYILRVLPNNNLTKIDIDILTPYSEIIPKFGSSENIPLQYLIDPSKDFKSNLNWSSKVELYLENVAKIDSVSIVIWT